MHQITVHLIGRRVAVAALVHIDETEMEMRYAGLGNISTVLISEGEGERGLNLQ
ncbi:hypothetical protein [Salipiger sp. PrR003]|uniref:hypothetical protein n=1 Tax=Salipiger sp. PrR003 TaxID=2706776 RepID=UPI0013DD22AE|nr:hypothetical protein [Salipiger sp. PrR003]NDV50743.1 hypothetical protein [Salipiger sp. PrR003]